MKFTAPEIANLLEGTVDGDDNVEISSLSKLRKVLTVHLHSW